MAGAPRIRADLGAQLPPAHELDTLPTVGTGLTGAGLGHADHHKVARQHLDQPLGEVAVSDGEQRPGAVHR